VWRASIKVVILHGMRWEKDLHGVRQVLGFFMCQAVQTRPNHDKYTCIWDIFRIAGRALKISLNSPRPEDVNKA
jgi:hypothetical protein